MGMIRSCLPTSYFTTQTKEERNGMEEEVIKTIRPFLDSELLKKMDYNNMDILRWLWRDATGKEFDLSTFSIEKVDLKKVERRIRGFIGDVTKKQNFVVQNLKLPRRILEKMPETDIAYQEIVNATLYRKRHLAENIGRAENFLKSAKKIIGQNWDKREYRKFQKLEAELHKKGNNDEDINSEFQQLTEIIATQEGAVNSLGKIQDLIEGVVEPANPTEKSIVSNWQAIRLDNAKTLLHGIARNKSTLKMLHKEGSVEHKFFETLLDDLSDAHKRIMFQTERDQSTHKPLTEKEVKEFRDSGFEEDEITRMRVNGEMVAIKGWNKYMPRYNLSYKGSRLYMDILADSILPKGQQKYIGKTREELREMVLGDTNHVISLVNRAKARGRDSVEYYSRDPFYYVNKYVHDVSYFNYHAMVQNAYIKAGSKMLNAYIRGGIPEQDAAAEGSRKMIQFLSDIKESALNEGRGDVSHLDSAVRLLNGFQFFRTMGFSIGTALKNRTQTWFDWVLMGTEGRRIVREAKGGPSQYSSKLYSEMVESEQHRFGMLFGEKGAISTATGGSVTDTWLPREFGINSEGEFFHKEVTSLEIAEEKMSWLTEKSAKFQQWAENQNRRKTFERAFILSYLGMHQHSEFYEKELMESRTTETKTPEASEVDAYIQKLSGNVAANAVHDIHFNYDNYAKAKILQSKKGQVIGQFQHFRFGFWDLQWNILKDALNSIRDQKLGALWTKRGDTDHKRIFKADHGLSIELQRAVRLGAIAFIPSILTAYTGLGIKNLMENDTQEILEGQYKYWIADPETPEGQRIRERYNPLSEVTGPTINWIKTIGQLSHLWHLDKWGLITFDDEYKKTFKSKSSEAYHKAKMISLQGARAGWHTFPALGNLNVLKAAMIETKTIPHDPMSKENPWYNTPLGKLYNSTELLPKIKPTRYKQKKIRRKPRQEDAIDQMYKLMDKMGELDI